MSWLHRVKRWLAGPPKHCNRDPEYREWREAIHNNRDEQQRAIASSVTSRKSSDKTTQVANNTIKSLQSNVIDHDLGQMVIAQLVDYMAGGQHAPRSKK